MIACRYGSRLLLFCCLLVGMATCLSAADQQVYLSSGGAITVYRIAADTGELTVLQEVKLLGAGPLGLSPDKRLLYATASQPAETGNGTVGAIATFRVLPTGKLERVHQAAVEQRPGYLMSDAAGRFLAGSHYGPGKASIWKLDDQGVYRGETVQQFDLERCAHSAVFAPDNRWLLVPATSPNKVFVQKFDPTNGHVVANDPPFAAGPQQDSMAQQPRHLIFHPTRPLVYTTNERLPPGVGVWQWDAKAGQLELLQTLLTQPQGFTGEITTADLHLTPDARFLYLSNRDSGKLQDRQAIDTIVAFAVDQKTGRLTEVGHYPCEHIPRSFALDDTGRYAYVAGQGDNQLGAYALDSKTGAMTRIAQYPTGKSPSWVLCLTAPGEK
ncbi:lactonase family protein [Lignipirellula cremea]|uniref:6-phosphogluconolactonase n=1 Tax=Lignipirellula cremea TaxID=2528010 RepID=A0A518DU54_9BACT|nr:beta-propeller fold lactonase family protein [Lignipirellula cremea]QDU95372.1 6-phosphogluconolactonase [Lignipirellula cremea]